MSDLVTTLAEIMGLALIIAGIATLAPFGVTCIASGVALVLVGYLEGRKQ